MRYDSDISFLDTSSVMFAATFTAVLAEGLSWLLIYRTDGYKQTKKNVEALNKQLEREKEKVVAVSKQKIQEKKISKTDNLLKTTSQQLNSSKMKSTMIIALFMIAFMSTLSSAYHGVVVAKLPFVPFSMLQGITHRNLPGDDLTDCSMIFIYLLTSFIMRNNIQKFFGFSPRTSFNMWEPPNYKS